MKTKQVPVQEDKCSDKYPHLFVIVEGSGRETGTPTWKCCKCPKKVKSS